MKDIHDFRESCKNEVHVVCRYHLAWCFCFAFVYVFANKEVKRRKKNARNHSGGLVINDWPPPRASPAIQSLPWGLGKLVAVITASPGTRSSAMTTAATPCWLLPTLGCGLPGLCRVFSAKVNPSCPVHSSIQRENTATISLLPTRLLNAVALSYCKNQLHSRSCSLTISVRLTTPLMSLVQSLVSFPLLHSLSVTAGMSANCELSQCHDVFFGTVVIQVLDRMHTLAQLAHLIHQW